MFYKQLGCRRKSKTGLFKATGTLYALVTTHLSILKDKEKAVTCYKTLSISHDKEREKLYKLFGLSLLNINEGGYLRLYIECDKNTYTNWALFLWKSFYKCIHNPNRRPSGESKCFVFYRKIREIFIQYVKSILD